MSRVGGQPYSSLSFDFRARYLAMGAALFAVFKGCADDAAIASVSSGYFLFPEMI